VDASSGSGTATVGLATRRPRRWPRRLAIGLAALLIAAVAAVAFVPPVRVGAQVALLVPELLGAGPRILSATTPEPVRSSLGYGPGADRMDVYRPGGDGPADALHPAVLLVMGVSPAPLDDPRVLRVGNAIARLGVVVGVPSSADLIAARLVADEPARVVAAFETLAGLPGVDPGRIGMAGFSVGASLSLIAAADPRITDRITWVSAFGAYADAATLLVDVATHSVVRDGVVEPWPPGSMTRRVFLGMLLEAVPDGPQRDALRAAVEPIVLGDGPTATSFDPNVARLLAGDALAAYTLATAADRAAAERAVADLTPERRTLLAAVSPVVWADRIMAPVFLMHEVTDDAIPVSHLAPLAETIPEASLRRVTEFRLFDHIEARSGIGLEDTPELVRLYLHLVDVVGVALG
jgi:hypothetical protein